MKLFELIELMTITFRGLRHRVGCFAFAAYGATMFFPVSLISWELFINDVTNF